MDIKFQSLRTVLYFTSDRLNDDLNEIPHNVTHVIDDLNANADFTSYNYSADHAHALKHNIHTPSYLQKSHMPSEILAAQEYVIVNQDLTGDFHLTI